MYKILKVIEEPYKKGIRISGWDSLKYTDLICLMVGEVPKVNYNENLIHPVIGISYYSDNDSYEFLFLSFCSKRDEFSLSWGAFPLEWDECYLFALSELVSKARKFIKKHKMKKLASK